MKPKHYPYSGKKRLPKIVSADKATEIVLSTIDSCVFQRINHKLSESRKWY